MRPKIFQRATSAAIAVSTLIATTFGVAPALADEAAPAITEIIAEVAPGILQETSTASPITVTDAGSLQTTDVVETNGATAKGIQFTIDYAEAPISLGAGLIEVEGHNDAVDALVQTTTFGVRVMTVITDASAPTSYNYTFDVPKDTILVEHAAGQSLESGEELLGTLLDPWAVDADGRAIPTSYSWDAGVLTQHVDLSSPDITYPVVADPAWSYSYKFAVTKTAAANEKLLKKCFNCYFPVSGAPKAFPAVNQLLPLKVGPANFECRFKSVFRGTNYFGFQFDATKNHIDKFGSNIIFQFRTIGGKKYLTVSAYVVNDAFWVKNAFYRSGAIQKWTDFANNLNKA